MRQRYLCLLLTLLLLAACSGGSDSDNNSNNNTDSGTAAATEAAAAPPESVDNAGSGATAPAAPSASETELAAQVNGTAISLTALERDLEIYQSQALSPAADQNALIATRLESLIDQALIEQAAAERGISITDAEIDAEISAFQQLAQENGTTMEAFFEQQGIRAEEIRSFITRDLLNRQVYAQVVADAPTTADEVHARHILVQDAATAQSLIQELNNGADFAALALQHSLDRSSREDGGDLGWISPGDLIQQEVESAILAMPAGSLSQQPIQSVIGFHVIEVLERASGRPLDATEIAQQQQQLWENWLSQQRAAAQIIRYVGPNAQQ